MKNLAFHAAAAALSIVFGTTAMPASAQLLGGLLGGDGGGGDVGGAVDSLLGGDVGGTVDSLLGGDAGGTVDGLVGGDVGIPGVASVTMSSNDDGANVNGSLLGGGGGELDIPLGSLLGGNSGANVQLPGIGGILGGPGTPGTPGTPGIPGALGLPGFPGINGANGGGGINGIANNGRNGIGGISGGNGVSGITSSRLRTLLAVLQNRAWMRFAQGRKICLPSFGVASVSGWIKPSEQGQLQQLLGAYVNDIATLQQMMKNCRNGQNQLVDVGRVIGVDLRPDGQIVVMTI